MRTYRPGDVPTDPAELPDFLRREFAAFQRAANRPEQYLELEVLHAEPAKVRAGMLVIADGTDWQPDGVNGEGLYRRKADNSAWVFIG